MTFGPPLPDLPDAPPPQAVPAPASVPETRFARPFELGVIAAIVLVDQLTKAVVRGSIALGESRTIITGLLDLTHVQNTGAAFGLLNSVDFPYKPFVMIAVASIALVAIAAYGTQLGFHDRLGPPGTRTHPRRRVREPARPRADRPRDGLRRRVLAQLALLGLQRRGRGHQRGRGARAPRHDRAGTKTCTPYCLRSPGFRSTPTASCSRPPTCWACSSRCVRARARGLDANRVMDLGIWIIISALVGAKLLLLIVEWDTFTRDPQRAPDADAFRGRVLRWTDRRRGGGAVVPAAAPDADVDGDRRVRPRHRARPRHRPPRLPLCGVLFRHANRRPVGDHLPQRVRRPERRHAAERAASPDAALRGRCGAADPRSCCSPPSERGRPFPGRTFWGYMLLYGISRFIIEFYRGDPARDGRRASRPPSSCRWCIVPLSLVMLVLSVAPLHAGSEGGGQTRACGVMASEAARVAGSRRGARRAAVSTTS